MRRKNANNEEFERELRRVVEPETDDGASLGALEQLGRIEAAPGGVLVLVDDGCTGWCMVAENVATSEEHIDIYQPIAYASGPRFEPVRHLRFRDDGYLNYPNARLIAAFFQRLGTFFDCGTDWQEREK